MTGRTTVERKDLAQSSVELHRVPVLFLLIPGGWIDEDVPVREAPFVPSGFVVPLALTTEQFRLEPLGPQHNDSDYEAWSSAVDTSTRRPAGSQAPGPTTAAWWTTCATCTGMPTTSRTGRASPTPSSIPRPTT